MGPLFNFTSSAKVVRFFGSSVEDTTPSFIWSFSPSTLNAVAARRRRSFLRLSAELHTAAPCKVMVLPACQRSLGGVNTESPHTTRTRSHLVKPYIAAT